MVMLISDFICMMVSVFFFKQKTAYEMRISDWSSDVCSSDLNMAATDGHLGAAPDVNADAPDIAHHAALDARMVAVARGIKVLTLVSWPASVQQRFLEGHARGHDVPPRIEYPRHDFGDARRELDAIAAAADPAHPLGAYLVESTRSWSTAARLRSEEHTSALQ